MNLIKKTKKI